MAPCSISATNAMFRQRRTFTTSPPSRPNPQNAPGTVGGQAEVHRSLDRSWFVDGRCQFVVRGGPARNRKQGRRPHRHRDRGCLMLFGAIAGRARSIPAGLALVSAGLATAAATSFIVTPFATGALLLSAALVLALAASGVATAKYIPFLSSAGLLLTLGGLWALLGFSTRDQPLSAGITGIVAIFALGVAPRLATILTGLSGLDDDQRQGKRITRNTTLDAVHAAHATLTGWTLAAAVIAGVAVVVVATAKNRPVWAVLLAVALLGGP